MADLQTMFDELKHLLQKYDKGPLIGLTELPNSKAKQQKQMYGLLGKKEVAIGNRKPQQTYFVGVILQKNFVGFYSMPVYSHPKELPIQNLDLKKSLKGKSCFNITKLDKEMLREIDNHIKRGLEIYKREGWV